MTEAIGLDNLFDGHGSKSFLEELVRDMGGQTDRFVGP
jgi:hypothetical protein